MARAIPYYSNADLQVIWCPGCKTRHYIRTVDKGDGSHVWRFNNNYERPTFHPSVKYFFPAHDGIPESGVCHFFVNDGVIQFQHDCHHEFNGQQVPLLDYKLWPVRLS